MHRLDQSCRFSSRVPSARRPTKVTISTKHLEQGPPAPKSHSKTACKLSSFLTMKHISIIVAFLAFSGNAPVGGASSAGSAALKAFREIDYRYFVAGGTCAAISHGITTPIDVVKTRMQANPKVSFFGKSLFSLGFRSWGKKCIKHRDSIDLSFVVDLFQGNACRDC